jgi:hypothetical protein
LLAWRADGTEPAAPNEGSQTTLQHVTPLIHVPDVRATVTWYESIGFALIHKNEDADFGMNFALLVARPR